MNVWEIAILRIVKYRGGYANTQEIYKELESGRFKTLSKKDLIKTNYGGRPAYQHQVRSHLSNLTQAGDLKRIARGTYALTEKGLKRIRE
ncbi:MAG: winged helix-turn-helix domain-containing protein [Candidatus Desulfofervidaceae bacterium]|nr:winged helix-turn-helix domain-containing protein [Candidatus Desulfofervidaceae bacterium]